jgi:ACR3 family arsenite efflux pump ArsB
VKLPRVMDDLREPMLLLGAAALGVMVSLAWPSAKPAAEWLVVPLLVLVLFSLFARVSLARLRDAARNSPLALPLAVVLFPAQPVIALSQLIEPVLEIPSLIILAALLKRRARPSEAPPVRAPRTDP